MMKNISMKFPYTIITLFTAACAFAGPFDPEDWITYRDFRYVLSCDMGRDYIYFTTTGGICRWDRYRQKWDYPLATVSMSNDAVSLDTVNVVGYDQNTGYMWCGSSSGLFSYDTMSEYWERIELPMGNPMVYSIGISPEKIWVEAGETYYSPRILFNRNPTYGMFTVSSSSELESSSPVRWVGERGDQPAEYPQYFVNQSGYVFHSGGYLSGPDMKKYYVTCSLSDGWGYTWLGFFGAGMGRVDDNTYRMNLYRMGPSGSKVKSLLLNKSTMWIGGNGLAKWNMKTEKWKRFQNETITGFESDNINDIAKIGKKIYFGTTLGLSILDLESGRFHTKTRLDNLSDSHITSLDNNPAELWIGTTAGVSVLHLKENRIRRFNNERIGDRYVNDIAVDGDFVWVGTRDGLYLHDRVTKRWTYVVGSLALEQSEVRAIHAGPKEVWVGRFLGVEYFDKDKGEFKGYPSVLFGNRIVNDVFADSAIVWLATDGGLYKFDRELERWVNFRREDGLPSDTIYVIQPDGDYLWLGTANGLTRFYWNDPYRLD